MSFGRMRDVDAGQRALYRDMCDDYALKCARSKGPLSRGPAQGPAQGPAPRGACEGARRRCYSRASKKRIRPLSFRAALGDFGVGSPAWTYTPESDAHRTKLKRSKEGTRSKQKKWTQSRSVSRAHRTERSLGSRSSSRATRTSTRPR